MPSHKMNHRIALPLFFVAIILLPGCETVDKTVGKVVTTCKYDVNLVATLGKTKVDVQKAYKSSAKKDVETARGAVKEMVATAESGRTATCSEPAAQAQKIQMLFDKMEFTKAKKAIDQNRLDNLLEAIDLAVATQNQLKK